MKDELFSPAKLQSTPPDSANNGHRLILIEERPMKRKLEFNKTVATQNTQHSPVCFDWPPQLRQSSNLSLNDGSEYKLKFFPDVQHSFEQDQDIDGFIDKVFPNQQESFYADDIEDTDQQNSSIPDSLEQSQNKRHNFKPSGFSLNEESSLILQDLTYEDTSSEILQLQQTTQQDQFINNIHKKLQCGYQDQRLYTIHEDTSSMMSGSSTTNGMKLCSRDTIRLDERNKQKNQNSSIKKSNGSVKTTKNPYLMFAEVEPNKKGSQQSTFQHLFQPTCRVESQPSSQKPEQRIQTKGSQRYQDTLTLSSHYGCTSSDEQECTIDISGFDVAANSDKQKKLLKVIQDEQSSLQLFPPSGHAVTHNSLEQNYKDNDKSLSLFQFKSQGQLTADDTVLRRRQEQNIPSKKHSHIVNTDESQESKLGNLAGVYLSSEDSDLTEILDENVAEYKQASNRTVYENNKVLSSKGQVSYRQPVLKSKLVKPRYFSQKPLQNMMNGLNGESDRRLTTYTEDEVLNSKEFETQLSRNDLQLMQSSIKIATFQVQKSIDQTAQQSSNFREDNSLIKSILSKLVACQDSQQQLGELQWQDQEVEALTGILKKCFKIEQPSQMQALVTKNLQMEEEISRLRAELEQTKSQSNCMQYINSSCESKRSVNPIRTQYYQRTTQLSKCKSFEGDFSGSSLLLRRPSTSQLNDKSNLQASSPVISQKQKSPTNQTIFNKKLLGNYIKDVNRSTNSKENNTLAIPTRKQNTSFKLKGT